MSNLEINPYIDQVVTEEKPLRKPVDSAISYEEANGQQVDEVIGEPLIPLTPHTSEEFYRWVDERRGNTCDERSGFHPPQASGEGRFGGLG